MSSGMEKVIHPFKTLHLATLYSWKRASCIWQEVAPARIHDDRSFGALCAVLHDPCTVSVEYEGWIFDLDLDTCTASCRTMGASIPWFYMIERIVFPILAICRGATLLHASAMDMENVMTVYMAGTGVGKSTRVASCMALHPLAKLVCDDVFVVAQTERGFCTVPGSHHIAMRHASFDGAPFVDKIVNLGFKHALVVKEARCSHRMADAFDLVLLEHGSPTDPVPCTRSEILSQLLGGQFVLSNAPESFRRVQFVQMVDLISHITVYRQNIDFHRETLDEAHRGGSGVLK